MLDFSEEHKVAQQAIRAWATSRLAPHVPKLESGDELLGLRGGVGMRYVLLFFGLRAAKSSVCGFCAACGCSGPL